MTRFGDVVSLIMESEGDVNRAAMLQRFPEFAGELHELFRNLDAVNSTLRSIPPPARFRPGIVPAPEGLTSDSRRVLDAHTPHEAIPGVRVESELRYGAQGVVYRARQLSTGRAVALKVIRTIDHVGLQRFQREARLAAQLRHPNIVTVLDAGIHCGRPFLVMEFVEGEPLDAYLAHHSRAVRPTVELWAQICEGVLHAHLKGVIHRDIKPSNVLVDEKGTPRLVDFGLAIPVDAGIIRSADLDERNLVVGTTGYIPPEVLSGRSREPDVRGDVYALGVLMGVMLSGRAPTAEPVPELRGDLSAILGRATAADPADRYQTVESLLTEIRQYLDYRPLSHKWGKPLYVLAKFLRRHVKMTLVMTFAVTSAAAALLLWRDRDELRDVSSASAWRRFELSRWADLTTLQAYQAQMQSANRVREIRSLPRERITDHMARYQQPSLDAEGVFEALVADMPDDLWTRRRASETNRSADATEWIRSVNSQLDMLSALVATQSLRFELDSTMPYSGLEWGREPITPASRACEAFTVRALLRLDGDDIAGSLDDLTTARRIAADLGDGALMAHKVRSAHCQDMVYACLQQILTRGLAAPEELGGYVEWILTEPDVVDFEPALLSCRMSMLEILRASIVTDRGGTEESFDLRRLDALLHGYLEQIGAITPDTIAASRAVTSRDIAAWIDRYVDGDGGWHALTSPQIQDRLDEMIDEIQRERQRQPALWIMQLPGGRFQTRLRTQSRRQALRVAAFAIRYRLSQGKWPVTLSEAVGVDNGAEGIDPRIGEPFGYSVRGDQPYVISIPTEDMGDPEQWPMEWTEGANVVYFPAEP